MHSIKRLFQLWLKNSRWDYDWEWQIFRKLGSLICDLIKGFNWSSLIDWWSIEFHSKTHNQKIAYMTILWLWKWKSTIKNFQLTTSTRIELQSSKHITDQNIEVLYLSHGSVVYYQMKILIILYNYVSWSWSRTVVVLSVCFADILFDEIIIINYPSGTVYSDIFNVTWERERERSVLDLAFLHCCWVEC